MPSKLDSRRDFEELLRHARVSVDPSVMRVAKLKYAAAITLAVDEQNETTAVDVYYKQGLRLKLCVNFNVKSFSLKPLIWISGKF